MATTKKDKILEWVRWSLAVLVIPLAIWAIRLETNNAVQNERIADLQKHKEEHGKATDERLEALARSLEVKGEQIKRLQEDLKEAHKMRVAIQANTVALGKLEVKIDATYQALRDLTEALRNP